MELISENLKESLCQQLVHEKLNANIYLYIAGFFKNKGLDHLGDWFLSQHEEETKHSLQIFEILTDLNTPVSVDEIPSADFSINTFMDIAKKFLDREIETTNNLSEILHLAIDEDNAVVEEFMRKMIVQQQHELEEATTFMDRANIFGDDWKWVLLFDASLG